MEEDTCKIGCILYYSILLAKVGCVLENRFHLYGWMACGISLRFKRAVV